VFSQDVVPRPSGPDGEDARNLAFGLTFPSRGTAKELVMRSSIPTAGVAAAILLLAGGAAWAADEEAGVPLAPSDAAGPWTLESSGHSICVLKLGAERAVAGSYRLAAPADCGDALPAGLAGWAPAPGGMNLVGADGRTLLGFGRWSNSLFVSHRSSGEDVQLRRGQ
jgi:hypothetical protein